MLMIAPHGYKVGPAGLEPPAGVRKRRKATVKKRRNTAPGFKALDPNNLCIKPFVSDTYLRNKTILTKIRKVFL